MPRGRKSDRYDCGEISQEDGGVEEPGIHLERLGKLPSGFEAIVIRERYQNINGLIFREKGVEEGTKGWLLHRGAACCDRVLATAKMKEDSASRTWFDVGWSVMPDKKFQGMGRIILSHEVIVLVGRKRFMG